MGLISYRFVETTRCSIVWYNVPRWNIRFWLISGFESFSVRNSASRTSVDCIFRTEFSRESERLIWEGISELSPRDAKRLKFNNNLLTVSFPEGGKRRSPLRHAVKINKKVATMLLNFPVIAALATTAPIISIAARNCLQRKLNELAPIIELVRALIGVNLWRGSNKLLLSILSLRCCVLHGVTVNTLDEQIDRNDIYDDNDPRSRLQR